MPKQRKSTKIEAKFNFKFFKLASFISLVKNGQKWSKKSQNDKNRCQIQFWLFQTQFLHSIFSKLGQKWSKKSENYSNCSKSRKEIQFWILQTFFRSVTLVSKIQWMSLTWPNWSKWVKMVLNGSKRTRNKLKMGPKKTVVLPATSKF